MFAVAVLEEAAGTCGFCGGGGREETKVGAGMRGSHSLSRETRGLENVLVSMRASVCVCASARGHALCAQPATSNLYEGCCDMRKGTEIGSSLLRTC